MKEIEVKFKVSGFDEARSKLEDLGASLVWQGEEENWFYDTKEGDIAKKGETLRIKKWGGHSNTITFKAKKEKSAQYKIRDEYQIEINDEQMGREILKQLGFDEVLEYKKYREHWKLDDAVIELDKLNNMYFVEIEASEERINELAEILNLDWEKSTTKSYTELLREE